MTKIKLIILFFKLSISTKNQNKKGSAPKICRKSFVCSRFIPVAIYCKGVFFCPIFKFI